VARQLVALALAAGVCACAREAPPARPAASAVPAAPATPGAPAAATSPIAVWLDLEATDAKTVPLAREWARELETVLAAEPGRFRLVKSEKEADLSVRIERIATPPDAPGHQVMTLQLAVDGKPAQFTFDSTGGPGAMAGKLARFLAGHVERARSGAAFPSAPATR
jgi:hypothetical protein